MNKGIAEFIDAIKARQSHLFIVSGNVYDIVPFENRTFDDFREFALELTCKKYAQCITYDVFSGMKIERGNEEEMQIGMGLKSSEPPAKNDKGAVLVEAMKKAKSGGKLPVNPLEAFPCMDKLLDSTSKPTVIVIDYVEAVVPAQVQAANQGERALGVALTKWARSRKIRENGHVIILICRRASDIEPKVLDRIFQSMQVRLSKPDRKERMEFLAGKKIKEVFLPMLSNATAGLSLRELSKIVALSASCSNIEEILSQVFSLKQKVFRDEYGDLMEVMDTRNGFEAIGGLEKAISEIKLVSSAMREGKLTLVPQGILFMGPPGTGKTVLAEAFAKEAGLNFVRPLDIKNMFVGQSETRMTNFLNAIKDLAPVVVFIDEFDQSQGKRGGFDGDSGVSKNLFKKMLEIMSDVSQRGKILWIFATNRPDLIDPAMKRSGRCDLRIPFLSPDLEQLQLICKAALKQYPDIDSGIKNWKPYAEVCLGYTGADMIEVIRRAWKHANENRRKRLTDEDMTWACHDYRPQRIDQKMVSVMTLLAIQTCSSKSMMPENWREIAQKSISAIGGADVKVNEENLDSLIDNAMKKIQED